MTTALAVHADWSCAAAKRWMAVARPEGAGWCVGAPEPVGDPATLLDRLRARAGGHPVALGLDCPFGLPRAFAAKHLPGWPDFPAFLRGLGPAADFWRVAACLEEVGPARPFYPARGAAGMTRLSHAHALGFDSAAALSRACDRATAERPAGAALFWTLGPNQSGKAALAAWREMVVPALHGSAPPHLWPFEGPFRALLAPGQLAIAETYPAEAMRHLGIRPAGSKRRLADRLAYAEPLRRAMAALGATADPGLAAAMSAGFGTDAAGEDRIDCVFGVLGVIGVLAGRRPDQAPDDPAIRRWEGWVLGQTALPLDQAGLSR